LLGTEFAVELQVLALQVGKACAHSDINVCAFQNSCVLVDSLEATLAVQSQMLGRRGVGCSLDATRTGYDMREEEHMCAYIWREQATRWPCTKGTVVAAPGQIGLPPASKRIYHSSSATGNAFHRP